MYFRGGVIVGEEGVTLINMDILGVVEGDVIRLMLNGVTSNVLMAGLVSLEVSGMVVRLGSSVLLTVEGVSLINIAGLRSRELGREMSSRGLEAASVVNTKVSVGATEVSFMEREMTVRTSKVASMVNTKVSGGATEVPFIA